MSTLDIDTVQAFLLVAELQSFTRSAEALGTTQAAVSMKLQRLEAVLGKRLVEARGHVHKVEGVRTVATFHPRMLMKRPSDKAKAWADLLLLMEDEV